MRGPLAAFKIFPDRGSRFVQVFIWRTLKELQAVKLDGHCVARNAYGLCVGHVWRPNHVGKTVADVHFCKSFMGGGMVSHEMFHATRMWLARSRRPIDYEYDWDREEMRRDVDENEEYGARIIEQLCRQFFVFIYEAGLAKMGDPARPC